MTKFTVLFSFFLSALLQVADSYADYDQCVSSCDTQRNSCYKNTDNTCTRSQQKCDDTLKENSAQCKAEYPPGSGRDACMKTKVASWKYCHENADNNCGGEQDTCDNNFDACVAKCKKDNPGSGGPGYRLEPCPEGTTPGPLGVCQAFFKPRKEPPPGIGGCPPGEEPGPTGRCVPQIKIIVAPIADGYIVPCPKGMKPSPIDGHCVMNDVGSTETEGTPGRGGRECPPGTAPDPRGGPCIPKIRKLKTDISTEELLTTLVGAPSSAKRSLSKEDITDLNEQFVFTTDPVKTLNSIEKQLGLKWQREMK
ncbi:MAG: hypothetical protein ACU833_06390 [Gammaproteobacteria bacterium]